MKTIEKGDIVICFDNSTFKKHAHVIKQIPDEQKEYKVIGFHFEIDVHGKMARHLELEGFIYEAFNERFFTKKMLTRRLAEMFVKNEAVERPEYERVFTLTADF